MRRDTTIRIFSLLLVIAVAVPAVQAALVVDAGGDRTVLAGEPVTILATYNDTDPAGALNISASIDWSTATTEAEVVRDDDHNGTVRGTCAYPAAGTYAVTVQVMNNATGTLACDTLNVTATPQPVEVKAAPKTLNQKSNGIMTIFVSLAGWLGFGDADRRDVAAADLTEFTIGDAMPEKVNVCAKDGGTLILKYRRADLDLAAGDGNLTVAGSVATENGNVSVAGSSAVSVINPGNGKKNGNGDGSADAAKVKEKDRKNDRKNDREKQQAGKVKGPAP
ncbi:hypothetical protein [Methanoculleus sp. 10]|uniref:hypothetical protein n=1 Tax=Methanoculleus sp. 10 TaxID=430615 RepID=UPI0025D84574|nr:hypothetical protein [Methanoculleus sp. 10]